MTSTLPTSGPLGFEVRPETVQLTCTNALVEGDLVMLTLSSGAYTACTKSDTADSTPDHILGVSLGTVAAGAVGEIAIKGQVKVSRHDTGAAGLAVVCGGAAGRVTAAPTDPGTDASAYIKVVGIALEAASSAGDLVECMFDGLNGFAAATAG